MKRLFLALGIVAASAVQAQVPGYGENYEMLDLEENGMYVDCVLKNGERLTVSPWFLAVGDEILSDGNGKPNQGHASTSLTFEGDGTTYQVTKPLSGREGVANLRFSQKNGSMTFDCEP